jgi:plasmid rolling circle replication initiator protein Rep
MMTPLESLKPRKMDIQDLKSAAYSRMGMVTAWRSAWNLSLEGEDPRDSRSPWVRLFDLEQQYALEHHRDKAKEVADLFLKSGLGYYNDRVRECAFYLDPSTPAYCRVRHCPICQWRRSQRVLSRAIDRLPDVIQVHPKHRWGFLTLTVKNCPVESLRATWGHLTDSFGRLTGRQEWRRVKGWIKSVEVKKRFDGTAHPHIHCLLLASSSFASKHYMSRSAWSELWGECLKVEYKPVVHFSLLDKCDDQNILLGRLLGCLKYQTKESDIVNDFDWFSEMVKQVHGMHALSFGGLIKSAMSDNDFVRVRIEDEVQRRIGTAMTNSTLPETTVNPKGETQAMKNMATQKRVQFKRF